MPRSSKNRSLIKRPKELTEDIRDKKKTSDRNINERPEIEQTRMENRRDADLEDKTPAGDGGPEDPSGSEGRHWIGENDY